MPSDLIAAIGQEPRTEVSGWFGGLDLAQGALVTNAETGRTSAPYVYAGGDAINGGASTSQRAPFTRNEKCCRELLDAMEDFRLVV